MGRLVRKYWPLLVLLALTFVLRVWRIEELFYYTYDEAIPSFVGRRLILWHHVPLIGGATPFGFHLGPYFYWFYAVLLFFGKLNPIIWGWAGAFLAISTTFLIYIVGKKFADTRTGFTAATFWSISFLANLNDRHLWALYWGPLASLLVLFFLSKIISGSRKYTYPLAIVLALALHADPSNLIFLGLTALTWIIYRIPLGKTTLIGILIIASSFLPLIVFDLRHDFANSKPVLDFIKSGKNEPGVSLQKLTDNALLFPRNFSRLFYLHGDNQIAKQYSYCQSYVREKDHSVPQVFLIFASIILISFIVLVFKLKSPGWKLTAILIVLYFLGIQIYGTILKGDIFEHYITGIFPAFLLVGALFISRLPKKFWLLTLAVFTAFNLYKLSVAKNSIGLKYKREAIEYTMQQVGEKSFSLDSLSTCWKLSGYRYLFTVWGKEPVKSYVDPNFAYLYGTTPVADTHPQTVVVFVTHDFVPETPQFYKRYGLLKSREQASAVFGNVEVIILDNSSYWFDK